MFKSPQLIPLTLDYSPIMKSKEGNEEAIQAKTNSTSDTGNSTTTITTTTTTTTTATQKRLSDLQSLYQQLKHDSDCNDSIKNNDNKLTGRQIKVPLTSKAFFEGTLQPILQHNIKGEQREEEELVTVNIGKGYMAEMNRDEACNYIKNQMDHIVNKSSTADKSISNNNDPTQKVKKDGKFQIKKGFLTNQNKEGKSVKASTKKTKQVFHNGNTMTVQPSHQTASSPSQSQILPYMEIKEEFDKDGNEVKAEAYNVSKELIQFQRQLKYKKEGLENIQNGEKNHGMNEEKSDIVNTLLDNLPINDKDFDMNNQINDDNDDDTEHNRDEGRNIEMKKTFDDISSRLDQLILLEEEDEKKKKENIKSSKRLRGKGWAKGFLDKSNSTAKQTKEMSNALVTKQQAKNVTVDTIHRNKRVQFTTKDEIQEIPRIGTKSLSSLNPSNSSFGQFGNNNIKEVTSPPTQAVQRETVPIGGIVERKHIYQDNTISVQTIGSLHNSELHQSSQPQEKKLSKFAQRRLKERS